MYWLVKRTPECWFPMRYSESYAEMVAVKVEFMRVDPNGHYDVVRMLYS